MHNDIRISTNRRRKVRVIRNGESVMPPLLFVHAPRTKVFRQLHGLCSEQLHDVKQILRVARYCSQTVVKTFRR